jgi:hypothetical protein
MPNHILRSFHIPGADPSQKVSLHETTTPEIVILELSSEAQSFSIRLTRDGLEDLTYLSQYSTYGDHIRFTPKEE